MPASTSFATARLALSLLAAIGVIDVLGVGRLEAQAPAGGTPAGTTTPGAAEQSAAEPPGYRGSIDSAINEYEAGHFAESRALFERANALYPNARSLRGMGMAEFELRNYPASIHYLELALSSTVKPLQDELRSETEQLLARARGFVGRVTFDLTPPEATVVLNGTTAQLGPDHVLNLIVGDYALEVSAAGYNTERRALRVAGGEEQAVRVQLPQQVEVIPTASTPAQEPKRNDSILASPWLWAAVGVAVAGAAVGIGVAASSGGTTTAEPSGGSSDRVLRPQ